MNIIIFALVIIVLLWSITRIYVEFYIDRPGINENIKEILLTLDWLFMSFAIGFSIGYILISLGLY